MTDVVLIERDGPVATVVLNRPERLNTMSGELLEGVLGALEALADDGEVRAVVLTGTGRAFCAGGDLQGMAAGHAGGLEGPASRAGRVGALRRVMRTSQLLHEMPKPTIARINGACAGAGLSWACACDLRYCADTAVFNTAFATAGLSGDFGGTWFLPRIVGGAKAAELYLLAEKFDAAEAERIGLVSRSVPAAALDEEVRRVASRLAGLSPLALQAIKANLVDSATATLAGQLDREAQRHIASGFTEDAREAAAAFLEKRSPVFRGR